MNKIVVQQIKQGLIEVTDGGAWASPCLLVKKASRGFRLVVNYRALNAATIPKVIHVPGLVGIIDSSRTFTSDFHHALKTSMSFTPKCVSLSKQVMYLGHVLRLECITPNPQKLEAVETLPSPQKLKEVFLGWRDFIANSLKNYDPQPIKHVNISCPITLPLYVYLHDVVNMEAHAKWMVTWQGGWHIQNFLEKSCYIERGRVDLFHSQKSYQCTSYSNSLNQGDLHIPSYIPI